MSYLEVIKRCRDDNIRLTAKNDKLAVNDPDGNLNPQLLEQLKLYKPDILAWLRGDADEAAAMIQSRPRGEPCPLSFAQQRLWFIDQLDGGSPQYNVPNALRIKGALDIDLLQRVVDQLLDRHEILRTVYRSDGDEPVQTVLPRAAVPIEQVDLSPLPGDERERQIRQRIRAEFRGVFDLATDLMLRCTLIAVGPQEHVLIFVMHHIACDGWSMPIIIREFSQLYDAYSTGGQTLPDAVGIQYADFAYWQRRVLPRDTFQADLDYWKGQLAELPTLHELPLDRPRPPQPQYVGRVHEQSLDRELVEQLNTLARKNNASLFMVLYSAYALVLARWSGQDDIVIGVPSAGRGNPQLQSMVGFFVNTLVFRTRLPEAMSFSELVNQTRVTAMDAYAHESVPFDLLVEELAPQRSMGHAPLCQVTFTMQSRTSDGPEGMSSLAVSGFESELDIIKFDLELSIWENASGASVLWRFAEDLFNEQTIERMAAAFKHLLRAVARDPAASVFDDQAYGAAERARLIAFGHGPDQPEGRDEPLPARFLSQAGRGPDAAAVSDGSSSLSYARLEELSGRLAGYLSSQEIGRGDLVAVVCPRSAELMIALLGVMRSGAAYVPVDPGAGRQRLAAMLDDGGIETVISVSSLSSRIPRQGVDFLFLDEALTDPDWLAGYDEDSALAAIDLDSPAYVIYTSGSTGLPKGVQITHRSLADYCAYALDGYYISEIGGSLVVTSHAFDITVPSLFLPLLTGGCVQLLPAETELEALAEALSRKSDARPLVRMTPSHIRAILPLLPEPITQCAPVFVIGGEAFPSELAHDLQGRFPHAKIYNHYGPTEATVGCTIFAYQSGDGRPGSVPIGRPMDNTRLYVVDRRRHLCPVGVPGELLIGGAGLASGYLRNPELTGERFIEDPFRPGERVYRTGDRVRWLNDGSLQFVGRTDEQIKLRGFRVEPAEIEYVMRRQDCIADAKVLPTEDGHALIAYAALDHKSAPVSHRIVSDVQAGCYQEDEVFELPNGMEVRGLNRTESLYLYEELMVEHVYLRHGVAVNDGDCVFDVGANIGMFSLSLLAEHSALKIFAFEPIPAIFEALKTNAALYGHGELVVESLGMSDAAGTDHFDYYPHVSLFSGLRVGGEANVEKLRRFIEGQEGEADGLSAELLDEMIEDRLRVVSTEVSLSTVSEQIRRHNVAKIDLLKIDVERSELMVLDGIDDAHWPLIQQVVVETEDADDRSATIRRRLEAKGFVVSAEQNRQLEGTSLVNLFATRQGDASPAPASAGPVRSWISRRSVEEQCREALKAALPDYMLPQKVFLLDVLPVLGNGKIDRSALPRWERSEPRAVAPRTHTEQTLATIWQDILGLQRVGVEDNFFALGGHSILATRVVSEISKQLHKKVPVRALFEHSTIRELAAHLDARELTPHSGIPVVSRDRDLPLSFAQQRLWFIDRLEGGSLQYNMPVALRLRGHLDRDALRRSLETIVERHEVLRTRFAEKNGQAIQVTLPTQAFELGETDLSAEPAEAQAGAVHTLAEREALKPFDLETHQMLRCSLLRLGDEEHVVLLTMHHIASDGWSIGVLIKEFAALYDACTRGADNPLSPLAIQYADFAAWQRDCLQGEGLQQQLDFWLSRLSGIPQVHRLPLDRPRPAQQSFRARWHQQSIDRPTVDRLRELALSHNATLFMVLQSAFALLLGRWSNETDIVMGVPVAGREHKELEPMIGFFINTLVFRTDLSGELSFSELLERSAADTLDAYANQSIPFELLVDEIKPARDLRYNPVFQIKFVLQNHDSGELALPGLEISTLDSGVEHIRFDLDLTATESPAGLGLNWGYKQDLFAASTIERLATSYAELLQQIASHPERSIHRLAIIDDSARQALLRLGRGVEEKGLREEPIPVIFERQALAHADDTAVMAGNGRSLSYAELNCRANRLAHYLREQGIGRGDRVGVFLERALELPVALLAVMKSGAAYVPLGADNSRERLARMISAAGIELVIMQARLSGELSVSGIDVMLIDEGIDDPDWLSEYDHHDAPATGAEVALDDSAYVIFTSGSSGEPKGVEVTHRGLLDYCAFALEHYYRDHLDGSIVITSHAFDITIPALYLPLLRGDCVDLLPVEEELPALAEILMRAENRSYLLRMTPSHARGLLWLTGGASVSGRHVLVVGGEAMPVELAHELQRTFADSRIYNHYGPTETVVGCCLFDVTENLESIEAAVPIGRPMANTSLLVLDNAMQPVPIGVIGELYIGGAGVAKGYVNSEELTAERFVDDPFVDRGTLYRSGDLVRWRADGNLEFIGRADEQVKLHGFRIELGEIETALLRLPEVAGAAVVSAAESQRLLAYVVPSPAYRAEGADRDGFSDRIRAGLGRSLPVYMVPAACVMLEELPLTANGKVDRRALPEVDLDAGMEGRYVAPRSETERTLCNIWEQVLGLERIGIHDNFFTIGGDSILSIQVVSRANAAGLALSARVLFEAQTVAELAARVRSEQAPALPQHAVEGELPLLPIQRQFLESDETDRHHYNQAVLLVTPAEFSGDSLPVVLEALYLRHDALRLRFTSSANQWRAVHAPLDAEMLRASAIVEGLPDGAQELVARCSHWQGSLNLAEGPLLRAVFFRGEGEGRLLLVVHHLVVDGVSWRVLLADLEKAHAQFTAGQPVVLEPKTSSLKQWAEALAIHARGESVGAERDYWRSQCEPELAPFPSDRQGPEHPPHSSTVKVPIGLSRERTRMLLQECGGAYRTQINELLLAGVYLGLRAWTGEPRLRIGLEGHGREEFSDELNVGETVGWFTTRYPLVLNSESDKVGAVIRAVKEQYRDIPGSGLGYGLLKYIVGEESLREAPAGPQLLFNYLGQIDQMLNPAVGFRSASEDAGASLSAARKREYALGLRGLVSNHELGFMLDYSSEHYERATMERLAGLIQAGLEAVIDHCLQPDVGSFTPSDFPLARVSQGQLDQWQQRYPDMVRLYPATPMQQGMLFHSLLDASLYITQTYPTLCGKLNAEAFQEAWQAVVDRHDIFRTVFVGQGRELHQLVLSAANLGWHEEDWRELLEQQQESRFEAYRQADKARGFDFSRAPLQRLALFRLAEDRYRVLWSHHHILSDGWSTPRIYQEVMALYHARVSGEKAGLKTPPLYERYMQWLGSRDKDVARRYWREQLSEIEAPTPLSVDRLGGHGSGHAEQALVIDERQTRRLVALAQAQRSTMNTIAQLAWGYLLHRYSGEPEVLFGATISGRPAEVPGIEEMVGLFINSVPVRVRFGKSTEIGEQLRELHSQMQETIEHGYLPLTEIQAQTQVDSGTALFDSLMVFENYPLDAAIEAESRSTRLQVESTATDLQTNYKLMLVINQVDRLYLRCHYRQEEFAPETIARLLQHLRTILVQLPEADAVARIELLSDSERVQLEAWNDTAEKADAELCLNELFEAQVARTPDAIAVVFENQQLSYQELDRRANRLAHCLIERGVRPDGLVGLCLERSAEMIVGLLAILKAGGAYVPLDPGYPPERIQFMLRDSGVQLVITRARTVETLGVEAVAVLLDDAEAYAAYPDSAPSLPAPLKPSNLAYVIYTSGSTGEPKGVQLHHRGGVNLARSQGQLFAVDPSSRVLHFASLSFDAATWEWLMALTSGAAMCLCNQAQRLSPKLLQDLLVRQAVTHATLPPVMLGNLEIDLPYALRCLIVAGEACDTNLAWRWAARCRLINAYGPTETTVCASTAVVTPGEPITIGRPLKNTGLQVLDEQLRRQPVGVVGELYVSGDGVAYGYRNRADLTAEKFLPNPSAGEPGGRIYRTGDLVRRLADGNLEFLGRVDDQVKIRGYRIEPGEIETLLGNLPQVALAAVVPRELPSGSRALVAYLSGSDPNLTEQRLRSQVREALASTLPSFLMPAAIVILDELPVGPTGKIDRRGLPAPDSLSLGGDFAATEGPTEQRLAAIWAELLEIDAASIGASSVFFELGGDSLLIVRLHSAISEAFEVEISMERLFEGPTLRELGRLIEGFLLVEPGASADPRADDEVEMVNKVI